MNLEFTTSLFCYQCGKLYESILDSNGEEIRQPFLGTCLHSICMLCFTVLCSPDCPICYKKNAFGDIIVHNTALEILKNLKESLTDEFQTEIMLKIINEREGSCSVCEQRNQKLYICRNCNQEKDPEMLIMISENDWILLPSEIEIILCCEQCLKNSGQHQNCELIAIEQIRNIEDKLYIDSILSQIHFQEYPGQIILNYFQNARKRLQALKKRCKRLEKEPKCCQHHDIKNEIQSKLKESENERADLMKREAIFYRDLLKVFLIAYEKQQKEVEKCESRCRLQNSIDELENIINEFAELPENWLEVNKMEKIDAEIEERMMKLENEYKEESFIEVEEVDGYFKYHALIKELKESQEEVDKTKEQRKIVKQKVNKYAENGNSRLQELKITEEKWEKNKESFSSNEQDNQKHYIDTIRNIFAMDQAAESIKVDKMKIECNKSLIRKHYADLLVLKYFPRSVDTKILDYFELIQEFKLENHIS